MTETVSPTPQEVATLMARLFALVQACPIGRVTTYSWLGKALGYPRGARMIGWMMNESPDGVPAQRVLNSKGELTGSWAFDQPGKMHQLLVQEGIIFTAEDRVDLKRYGWDPSHDLNKEELQHILDTANISTHTSPRLLHLLRHDPASPLRNVPPPQPRS